MEDIDAGEEQPQRRSSMGGVAMRGCCSSSSREEAGRLRCPAALATWWGGRAGPSRPWWQGGRPWRRRTGRGLLAGGVNAGEALAMVGIGRTAPAGLSERLSLWRTSRGRRRGSEGDQAGEGSERKRDRARGRERFRVLGEREGDGIGCALPGGAGWKGYEGRGEGIGPGGSVAGALGLGGKGPAGPWPKGCGVRMGLPLDLSWLRFSSLFFF